MTDGNNAADAVDNATAEWDDALLFEVAVDPFKQIAISGKEDGRAAGLRDGYLEGVNIGKTKGWEIGLELGYIDSFARGILEGYQARLQNQHQNNTSTTPSQSQDTTQKTEQRVSHRLERCFTLARDLVKMVDEFPDPDSLLSQNDADKGDTTENETEETPTREETHIDISECSASQDNGCTTKSTAACCKSNATLTSQNSNVYEQRESDELAEGLNFGTSSTVDSDKVSMVDVSSSIERIRAKFKLLCVLLKTKQSFDLKKVLELGDSGLSGMSIGEKEKATSDTKVEITETTYTKSQDRINTAEQDSPGGESDW